MSNYGTSGRGYGYGYGMDDDDDSYGGGYGGRGAGSNYGSRSGGSRSGGSRMGSFGQGGRGGQERGAQGTGSAYQMAPLVVGGLMAALGVRRGGWLGYGIALAGLGVIQQAFSGKPDIAQWVGMGGSVDHESRATTVSHTVTINRSAEDLYSFWRDFSNLPQFMNHIERIEVIDDRNSHWVAKAPAGLRVSWDAQVTDDQPNRRLAWRAIEGSDVPNWGHVEFRPAPGGRGTELHAVIRYEPPGGALGRAVAKLLGEEPQQQMVDDLNRFKRMMETTGAGSGSSSSSTSSMGGSTSSVGGTASGATLGGSTATGSLGGSTGSTGSTTTGSTTRTGAMAGSTTGTGS